MVILGKFGDVAQLGEHRLCKAGVRGSSPLVSTEFSLPLMEGFFYALRSIVPFKFSEILIKFELFDRTPSKLMWKLFAAYVY